jgi:hypothetical protein
LAPCLVVLALGLLAGKRDLAELQRFGTRRSQAQRKALGFWPKKGTKFYPAPTYNVLRDLLIALDLDAFAAVLTRWLQSQVGRLPAALALDGKTIRDHLGCIVSLVEHEDGAPRRSDRRAEQRSRIAGRPTPPPLPRGQSPGLRRHR